jgi:hypothetical protein
VALLLGPLQAARYEANRLELMELPHAGIKRS